MACNDPFHRIFADIIADMDVQRSYRVCLVNGAAVRHRYLPSYSKERHELTLRAIQDARAVAISEVASGVRNGFDLIRIDRDAERLERRSMGKRYGATVKRTELLDGNTGWRTVDREQCPECKHKQRVTGDGKPSQTTQQFTAASFLAAVRKQGQ